MYRRASQILAGCLLIVIIQPGWSETNNPSTSMNPDPRTYFEKYDKTVDVAGQLRAGLMYESVTGKVDIQDLRLDLGFQDVKENETACIRLTSRSGEFSAIWEITLKTETPVQVISIFPTEYEDLLESYGTDELVAIASVVEPGQKCSVAGQRYLPSSWGEPDRSRIVAYLNADSTEALIAGKTADKPLKDACRILPATENNTAFDTVCSLNLAGVADNADAIPVKPSALVVLRKSFSTVMKKINYPLSSS